MHVYNRVESKIIPDKTLYKSFTVFIFFFVSGGKLVISNPLYASLPNNAL